MLNSLGNFCSRDIVSTCFWEEASYPPAAIKCDRVFLHDCQHPSALRINRKNGVISQTRPPRTHSSQANSRLCFRTSREYE